MKTECDVTYGVLCLREQHTRSPRCISAGEDIKFNGQNMVSTSWNRFHKLNHWKNDDASNAYMHPFSAKKRICPFVPLFQVTHNALLNSSGVSSWFLQSPFLNASNTEI